MDTTALLSALSTATRAVKEPTALGALVAVGEAVKGITDQLAEHEAQIAALKAQVQLHDTQLKTAPEPGPPTKG